MAMIYDPVIDSFQVYESAPIQESPVKFRLPLEDVELPWASSIVNGNPVPKDNISELRTPADPNYQDVLDRMAESNSTETVNESPQEEISSDNYVSGTYAQKHKGDKQLLESTIEKLNDPNISRIKGFLLDTAALESGFKYNITSKASTGSGWFGFLDGTKKQFAPGVSRNEFNNNPEIQIQAASRLYYNHLNTAKKLGMLDAAKKKGYSTDDVIHAMWLNPTWAKNFFLYGQEGGKDAFGTNIRKYLNKIHGRK